jgi:hypothetical protein
MKKVKTHAPDKDMRSQYDFTGAERGKYFERFQRGTNLVLLEPDVAAAFPTSEAVNRALRSLAAERGTSRRVIRRSANARKRTSVSGRRNASRKR